VWERVAVWETVAWRAAGLAEREEEGLAALAAALAALG